MNTLTFSAGVVAVALAALTTIAAEPAVQEGTPEVLKTLRQEHPRLFITPASITALQEGARQDPDLKQRLADLCKAADKMIDEPPVEHVLKGAEFLLGKSRTCLERVSTLALAWQMTGVTKYADRAVKELLAVAAFPDWSPKHFLDTAEMSCAVGIGYDWLYPYMDKGQRATVRNALIEKGLTPGLESYRGKVPHRGWVMAHNNWSQVCNGGLAVGALAIADEAPEMASEILTSGFKAVRGAMANFGPDGSWNEGPGYWGYATRYTAFYLEALKTALGTMHDLEKTPGFSETGFFKIHASGPTGLLFNFADCSERGEGQTPQMFWMAGLFGQPLYAWEARQVKSRNPFNLIWWSREGTGPAGSGIPLNKYFRRDNIVFLRSAWEDQNAMWVGFKGGDNKASHSHLDLGSFVLDALGERWGVDLGGDDYNLPGYFGKERGTYFRLKTESHNTLLIDNTNQDTKAGAPITAFSSGADGGSAIADLSKAYPMTTSTRRGLSLRGGTSLVVQDEVVSGKPVEVLWGIITRAQVATDGANAVLEQKQKRIHVRILSPAGAVFQTLNANPPPPQRQQPGATKLAVKLPAAVTNLTLVVVFSIDQDSLQQPFKPLAQWAGQMQE